MVWVVKRPLEVMSAWADGQLRVVLHNPVSGETLDVRFNVDRARALQVLEAVLKGLNNA